MVETDGAVIVCGGCGSCRVELGADTSVEDPIELEDGGTVEADPAEVKALACCTFLRLCFDHIS